MRNLWNQAVTLMQTLRTRTQHVYSDFHFALLPRFTADFLKSRSISKPSLQFYEIRQKALYRRDQ